MEALETRLYNFVREHPGMRARLIAAYLNVDKSSINRILYQNIGALYSQDSNWGWSINGKSKKVFESDNIQIVSMINTIHSIFRLMFEQDDEEFKLDNVKSDRTEQTYLYYIDEAITRFYFDLALDEEEYEFIDEDEFNEYLNEYEAVLSRYVVYSDYEDSFAGFYTRKNKIPIIFGHASEFDKKYKTSYALIMVDCFRLLGEAILLTLDITETNTMKLEDHINDLKKYVLSQFDNYLVRCDDCGEVVTRDECHEMGHELICDDCYDSFDSDDVDDEDISDEVDEEIDKEEDENILSDEDESDKYRNGSTNPVTGVKIDITEDCKTCKSKQLCPKAKLNVVCEHYKYYKDPIGR